MPVLGLRRRRPELASGAAASSACLAAAGWARLPLPRPDPDALAVVDAAAFLAVVRLVGRSAVAWLALAPRLVGAAASVAGAFLAASWHR